MGGAVSSGRDNNELIDNLMNGGYIRSRSVERVFRVLDRGDYMSPTDRDQAYKDLAWRSGALHLSAPCIYSEVMEALELKPGLSFLNLGSGTGYLSSLVGLILGSSGISHGVEIHPGVVEYSTKKLNQFQENSITLDEFDFCIPRFYCGNALCLAPLQSLYDRVYVGAGVLPKYENYFKQLIKVRGVLVMPLGDTLVQFRRVSDTEWTSRQLLNVSFAVLRAPTKEEAAEPLKLEELVPVSLMLLSRAKIRFAMRGGVCRRHPELMEPAPRRPPAPRARSRRICIPLDTDTDDAGLNELHDLENQEGGREMNALLSLVLSMGNNRVAGSLRFGDERRRLLPRAPGADPADPAPLDPLAPLAPLAAHHPAVEVLIDNDEDEDDESSESSSSEEEPAPVRRSAARPSAAGAANASRSILNPAIRASIFCSRRAVPAGAGTRSDARGVARARGEAAPHAAASGTELSALNVAGHVEVDPEAVEIGKPTVVVSPPGVPGVGSGSGSVSGLISGSGSRFKPSTSGKSAAVARAPKSAPKSAPSSSASGSGGGSSGGSSGGSGGGSGCGSGGRSGGGSGGTGKRGGSDSSDGAAPRVLRRPNLARPGARTRQQTNGLHSKRFPPEVQIYFGNAGVYAGSDVVQPEPDEQATTASEDVSMDASSSSDNEPLSIAKDKKRQKLDSGAGSGGAGGSRAGSTPPAAPAAPPTPAPAPATDAHADAPPTNNQTSGRRGSRGSRRRADSGSESRASRARRRARDARRVRLSIVMKRAIKELPLPYALKKYVNLHRCFEF